MELSTADRLPPHSIEAEQGVLGCCLLAPAESLPVAIEKLKTAEVFYDARHQLLFERLVKMFDANEPIDLIVVSQKLRDEGQLESMGGVAYLSSLMDAVPSAANLPYYADIVDEKKTIRDYLRLFVTGMQRIYSFEGEIKTLTAQFEAEVMAIGERSVKTGEVRFSELLPQMVDRLEEFSRGRKQMQGLSTGFNFLDNMLCGMKPGEMIVVAARPSVGKTSVVMQIAEFNAADCNIPVGVFSMEMTSLSLVERQVFSRARADFQKYRNGYLINEDLPKLATAIGQWAKAPLWVDDASGLTPRELRIKARRMKRKYGIKLLCIDYIQLMDPDERGDNRANDLGEISKAIKRIAKELEIPVVVLAQMNRDFEKDPNRKPQLSDLKDSGSIEQDADVVAFLYDVNLKKVEHDLACNEMQWVNRAKDFVPEDDRQKIADGDWKKVLRRLNLLVAKQRNGPTGDVALVYLKRYMRFIDAYRPREEGEDEQSRESGPLVTGGGDRRAELPSTEEMWPDREGRD
jgi:replicative DNA helicase